MKKELLICARYIFLFFPRCLKKYYRKKVVNTQITEARKRMKRTKISKEELIEIFKKLPSNTSDIMIHTSLMNIGKIFGGVEFIADQIKKYVDTSRHTMLIVALSSDTNMKEYLENIKDTIFDINKAPVSVGAINEYYATRTDALRSIHPTHSVVAIGPNAYHYVGYHHLDTTPFYINSPYYKIIANGGKILTFGTPYTITAMHVIEDMFEDLFPVCLYARKKYSIQARDHNNNLIQICTPYHNPYTSIKRDANVFFNRLKQHGLWNSIPIGESEIVLLDARKVSEIYLDMIIGGESLYGKHKVTDHLKAKALSIKKQLKIIQ